MSTTDRATLPLLFGTSNEIPASDVVVGDCIASRYPGGACTGWLCVTSIDTREGILFTGEDLPFWGGPSRGKGYAETFRSDALFEVRASAERIAQGSKK